MIRPSLRQLACILIVTFVGVCLLVSLCSAERRDRQLRIFDELWKAVRDHYLDPDYNGADWAAVREETRARVEAGLSDEGFWLAMDEMLRELNDDHSCFLTPDQAVEQDHLSAGRLDYVGIGIIPGALPERERAVVLLVLPNSPAARAGLRPHDRLLSADGMPVCCDEAGSVYLDHVRGPEGSTVSLEVQTPGEPPRTVTVTRARVQTSIPVQVRQLQEGIGYLLIPTLKDETAVHQVGQGLLDLAADGEPSGLIIDLRINPGGSYSVLRGLLSFFTDGQLGHFVSRTRARVLSVNGVDIGGSQRVGLVILVGRDTASYAEVLSGLLQETGRAQIVGSLTPGNVETVRSYNFEDGSRAWIAQETFRPFSGTDWEETGIVPDVEIPLDWDEFTEEDDIQLEAALALLTQAPSTDLKSQLPGEVLERYLAVEAKDHALQPGLAAQIRDRLLQADPRRFLHRVAIDASTDRRQGDRFELMFVSQVERGAHCRGQQLR